MEFVNCMIYYANGNYAASGIHFPHGGDPDLMKRMPKLRQGEVIEVPADHWLTQRRTVEVTKKPITRPYCFATLNDASTYRYGTTPLKPDVLARGLAHSRERFAKLAEGEKPVAKSRRRLVSGG